MPKYLKTDKPFFPKIKLKYIKNPYLGLEKTKQFVLSKPTRIEFIAKLLKNFKKSVTPEKWVFIIGCYNSGTTLLETILSEHPEISVLDEGVFKTNQLITPEELGWTRMWYKTMEEVRLTERDTSVDPEEVKRDWALFFDPRKRIFLEKSIVNSARIRWLQKHFQDPYFIFIVRNGYAVAEGIRRKTHKSRWGIPKEFGQFYPIKLCAQQWVTSNQIIEKDSKKIINFKKIFYEELCDFPKRTIKKILNFLDIESEISWNKDQKWEIQEKYSRIKNMNDKSISNLNMQEIKDIETIAKETLEYYGYPLLSKEI